MKMKFGYLVDTRQVLDPLHTVVSIALVSSPHKPWLPPKKVRLFWELLSSLQLLLRAREKIATR